MVWYYSKDDRPEGPVDDEAILSLIKDGTIAPHSMVWRDGWSDWKPARDTELASHFGPPPIPPEAGQASSGVGAAWSTGSHNDGTAAGPEPGGSQTSVSSFDRDPNFVYPSNPPKTPHLCWLNLLVQGIAQMVFGQIAKGIVILLFFWLIGPFFIGFFGALLGDAGVFFMVLVIVGLAIASLVDAFKVGKSLAQGQPVGKWQFFPKR